jgi:NADH dehydrogenase FAD-containing subunit
MNNPTTGLFEDSGSKNIIVIGAGYGGLTAALRLERLLKKETPFYVHLIELDLKILFGLVALMFLI